MFRDLSLSTLFNMPSVFDPASPRLLLLAGCPRTRNDLYASCSLRYVTIAGDGFIVVSQTDVLDDCAPF